MKKLSIEHRRKISLSLIGNKHSLGFKQSEESKQKKRETNIRLGIKPPSQKGKKFTLEHRAKLGLKGEKNPMWKGDKVGYSGLHLWVEGVLGKPKKCSYCGREDLNPRQYHWANVSHKYKREITDWVRLCVTHHRLFDLGKIVISTGTI